MGRKFTFRDQEKIYFITFTVINWIDVYIRDSYRDIFYESMQFCQKEKGLEIYAYCIMTSHIHLIIGRSGSSELNEVTRDIKSFTSRHTRKEIENNVTESRREWIMWMLKRAGKHNTRNKDFQFWIQDNHPIELSTNEMMQQRLDYIHNNPVEAGFVDDPCAWVHSSARDYAGEGKGRIELTFIG
jgi:REP element-mobilizing transposase RayT